MEVKEGGGSLADTAALSHIPSVSFTVIHNGVRPQGSVSHIDDTRGKLIRKRGLGVCISSSLLCYICPKPL